MLLLSHKQRVIIYEVRFPIKLMVKMVRFPLFLTCKKVRFPEGDETENSDIDIFVDFEKDVVH